MPQPSFYQTLQGENPLAIHLLGPPLEIGPLPTLIYFALSGEESLQTDPYNQPVLYATQRGFRVVSFTLPGHGPGCKNTEAMALWAEEFAEGRDPLAPFLAQVQQNLDFLHRKNAIVPLAAAGLSRGGFIALHLAARTPSISAVVGFAPLIQLSALKEFQHLGEHPMVKKWDLFPEVERLVGKQIRFSIGNRDLRVDTRTCFAFTRALAEANFQAGHRSPPVELIITPSIGAQGHGTSPASFHAGIDWLINSLRLS